MYMSMKMEMKYVAPEVEVLEVAIEKGFEGSQVEGPGAGGSGQSPAEPF